MIIKKENPDLQGQVPTNHNGLATKFYCDLILQRQPLTRIRVKGFDCFFP